MVRRILVLGTLLAVGTLIACSDSTAPGTQGTPSGSPQIRVMLTDAPSDYIDTALVSISRVYLKAGGDETPDIDLFNDPEFPQVYDLLTLRDGLAVELGQIQVAEGDYDQLRMVVDSAMVSLVDSLMFEDGGNWAHLKVPSGSTSGIKVQLADPVPADSGLVTIVTVDFDVDDNFKIQGNPETPAGIKGILFTPTLKEKGRVQEQDDDEDESGDDDDDDDDEAGDDDDDDEQP